LRQPQKLDSRSALPGTVDAVETVEKFELRIAAIISGNPEAIPATPRTNPLLVRRKKRPEASVERLLARRAS